MPDCLVFYITPFGMDFNLAMYVDHFGGAIKLMFQRKLVPALVSHAESDAVPVFASGPELVHHSSPPEGEEGRDVCEETELFGLPRPLAKTGAKSYADGQGNFTVREYSDDALAVRGDLNFDEGHCTAMLCVYLQPKPADGPAQPARRWNQSPRPGAQG